MFPLPLLYHDRESANVNDIFFNDAFDGLFESEENVIKRKLEKTLDYYPLSKYDDLN